MAGRSLRARAPVSYNDKADMIPAWMRSAGVDKPKGSGKENSASSSGKKESVKRNKPAGSKKATSTKEKIVDTKSVSEDLKEKKSKDSNKNPKVSVRGRNAGIRVVPIEDKSRRHDAIKKAIVAPKLPAEPREIPGLPGVVQKNSMRQGDDKKEATKNQETRQDAKARAAAMKPVREISSKRKAEVETPPSLMPTGLMHVEKDKSSFPIGDHAHEARSKRKRQENESNFAQYQGLSARNSLDKDREASMALNANNYRSFSAPKSEMQAELEAKLEKFYELNMEYRSLCNKLREENEALKNGDMMASVERLFEEQNAKMEEHVQKSSQLAQYWREEAARLSEQVEKLGGGDNIKEEVRKLRNQLHEATQALLDHERAAAEKEKTIASLKIENERLKKYARVPGVHYKMEHKCIQTDAILNVEAAVQTGNAVHLSQARALAPEGAENSSWYTNSLPPANIPGDESYGISNQRTAYRPVTDTVNGGIARSSASDMQLDTNESVQGRGPAGTRRGDSASINLQAGEGLQHVRRHSNARRLSSNPKDFSFYSDSAPIKKCNARGEINRMPVVPEEQEPSLRTDQLLSTNPKSLTPASANTSGSHISAAAGLLKVVGFREKILPNGALKFTHPATGFIFVITPESESQNSGHSQNPEWEYRMESWGNAEFAFKARGSDFHSIFGGECIVPEEQLLKMCEHIRDTLSHA